MTPEVSTVPIIEDADPCQATKCDIVSQPVEACRVQGCPYRWQREGRIDRKAREEKDAARSER